MSDLFIQRDGSCLKPSIEFKSLEDNPLLYDTILALDLNSAKPFNFDQLVSDADNLNKIRRSP